MRTLLIIATILIATSCAEYKVRSSQDPKAKFDKYTTWCWFNNCNPTYEGPDYLVAQATLDKISNVIAEEISNKGYIQGDENADLVVDYQLILKEDSARNAIIYEEQEPLWEQYEHADDYHHFLKGSLIIYIADREQGKIVFKSVTERYLPSHPEITYAELRKGIKRALKDLPPKAKNN